MDPYILQKEPTNKIRSLRTGKNLTMKELSKRSDISPKYLGEIERAEKYPSLEIIISIANALEIDLLDLFYFSDLISLLWDEKSRNVVKSIYRRMMNFGNEYLNTAFNITNLLFFCRSAVPNVFGLGQRAHYE